MAEQFLAGWPLVACDLCGKPTDRATGGVCPPCWHLRQSLTAYVPLLLADTVAGPRVRALLGGALLAKPEPTETA